jgi:hypothetical protein
MSWKPKDVGSGKGNIGSVTAEKFDWTFKRYDENPYLLGVEYVPPPPVSRPWGDRGLFGGGSPSTSVIDYVTISTAGNAINFGNLTGARSYLASCSDGVKGLFGGSISSTSVIDYVTISTAGNATFFGNLTVGRGYLASCSGN